MNKEQAIKIINGIEEVHGTLPEDGNEIDEALSMAIKALQSQADEDAISRQAVLDLLEDTNNGWIINEVLQLPSVKPQEPYDFAKWVATEIFAEWEYNKDAFAEIACRKLAKLGIVRAKGDEWDLPSVTPQPKTGHWIMRHREVNTINYRTGEDVLTGEIHTVKELIRYETDEPYCECCGKRAEDISQDYCGYCGAKMVEPQESEEA